MSTELTSIPEEQAIYDWNELEHNAPVFRDNIELCDETLRDGIQSPSVVDPPIETKLELVDLMDKLGITIANIGLPGAGPRAVEDVTTIAKYIRDNKLSLKANTAARTVVRDIEPVVSIQQEVGIPIAAYCFLGTSPLRLYAEGWDVDFLLRQSEKALKFGIDEGLEVAFVTEDTIRSSPKALEPLFRNAINLGVRRLVLCDTVGHATPDGIKNLVDWTREIIKDSGEDVKIDWHGHNDRGLGLANALFAAEYGCDRIHGTALGVGERVGNVSLDQLILNLKLMGAWKNDVSHLVQYTRLVGESTRVEIPVNYPLSGRDAFRTATGVHAAAVIKAIKTGDEHLADIIYSGVPAGWFGREQEIEIGHQSGLSNIKYWLYKRKIDATDELIENIFTKAKAANRTLRDDEVLDIIKRHEA
ncbi:MAG: 2-isopropylmalate synthase [Myxococcales bacterium]|nr:2-isopropylmalate synthase [Myxococcales bacterium]